MSELETQVKLLVIEGRRFVEENDGDPQDSQEAIDEVVGCFEDACWQFTETDIVCPDPGGDMSDEDFADEVEEFIESLSELSAAFNVVAERIGTDPHLFPRSFRDIGSKAEAMRDLCDKVVIGARKTFKVED